MEKEGKQRREDLFLSGMSPTIEFCRKFLKQALFGKGDHWDAFLGKNPYIYLYI